MTIYDNKIHMKAHEKNAANITVLSDTEKNKADTAEHECH